jgi:hypothetical protein
MEIVNLNKLGNSGTYIGLTNSSIVVDENCNSVFSLLHKAWSGRRLNPGTSVNGSLLIQLHSGGKPVLVSVESIEVIGKLDGD